MWCTTRYMVVHTHRLWSPLPNMQIRMASQWMLSVQWVDLRSFTTAPPFRAQPWIMPSTACYSGWLCILASDLQELWILMAATEISETVLDTEHANFAKNSEKLGPSNWAVTWAILFILTSLGFLSPSVKHAFGDSIVPVCEAFRCGAVKQAWSTR